MSSSTSLAKTAAVAPPNLPTDPTVTLAAVTLAAVSHASGHVPVKPNDKKIIQDLLWVLKPFVDLRRSIPLPFVTTFLVVALNEGLGVSAYARAVGVSRAAMSRYLRDVGDRARNGGPGLGLVRIVPFATNRSRSRVLLTPKGRRIIKELFRQAQISANAEIENQ
jgi:hypothetical protein